MDFDSGYRSSVLTLLKLLGMVFNIQLEFLISSRNRWPPGLPQVEELYPSESPCQENNLFGVS